MGLKGIVSPRERSGVDAGLLTQVNGLGLDSIPMQFHEPQRGEITKPRPTAWV